MMSMGQSDEKYAGTRAARFQEWTEGKQKGRHGLQGRSRNAQRHQESVDQERKENSCAKARTTTT